MAEDTRWVSPMEAPRALPSCQVEEEEEEEDAGRIDEQGCRDSEPASTSAKPCVWGTWEQLLLASAVKKHGINNWGLVSAELQARARAMLFTPEACRAEYYAIKGQYGNIEAERGGDGANDIPWFDELRRLRVSQLKKELEHYDATIGSLESKLKKLTAEREKSLQLSPLLSGQILREATLQKDGLIPQNSTDASQLQQACDVLHPVPSLINHKLIKSSDEKAFELESIIRKEEVEIEPSVVKAETDTGMREAGTARIKHSETEDASDSMVEPPLPAGKLETAMPTATMLQRSLGDDKGRTTHTQSRSDTVNTSRGVALGKEFGGEVSTVGVELVAVAKPDRLEGTKQNSSPELGDVQKLDLLRTSLNSSVPLDLNGAKVAKALLEPLSTSRPSSKSVQSSGSGRLVDDSSLFLKQQQDDNRSGPSFDKEACLQDDDDKHKVCKLLCTQVANEVKPVAPVESADSTEVKQQQEGVPAITENKQVAQVTAFGKMSSPEEATSKQGGPKGKGGKVVASKEVATTSGPADTDGKLRSTSSTENSELHEVWGESAEVVENKRARTKKRARTSSWGKKRKLKKQSSNEPSSIIKEERDERSPSAKTTELSVKTESVTMSHEGSDSLHDKAENDFDAETWHQTERLSGDSRVEKSEMGSFVDGNEDISPMSRRNKREPKVSGKLIPLLECLRAICAHKCAPLFKHNQEIQDNPRYEQLIRSPVDLGLIRARLEEGQYTGSLHFFRDLLLMVNNALVYYSRDTQEYVAAMGLRECVVKEMATVFETEALLKREGPTFRKRDAGKAGFGLQKKRKAVERSLATDMTSKDVSTRPRGQSDLSTSMDSRCNQIISAVKDVGQAMTDTKQTLKDSGDTKIASSSEGVRGLKIMDELKKLPSEKTASSRKTEMKDQGCASANIIEGAKPKEKLGGNPTFRKVSAGKGGSALRTTAGAPSKALGNPSIVTPPKTASMLKPVKKDSEGSISGIHPSAQQPDIVQEPVKRGVGRPPKHSQQRSSRKAKQVEAPIPPRKRVRR